MKNLLLLVLFTFLVSNTSVKKEDDSLPQKVTITGKIEHIDPDNLEVQLYINSLGVQRKSVMTKADISGHFHATFDLYTPTDVWVTYKTNFMVLAHPGDSIHVVFDGQHNMRPPILETIQFSGDGVKANQDAAKFQLKYFADPLYNDWDAKERAKKTYDVDQYLLYLDTLQQRIGTLYSDFVDETAPDKNVEIWAKLFIEQDYYNALTWYPIDHLRENNLKASEWAVPKDYYDALLNRLPIEKNMFISGYALSNFINRFHYHYAREKIWEEEQNQAYKAPEGYIVGPTEIIDSLNVYGIIKYTPDDLLRQMVLTEFFQQNLNSNGIRLYENYITAIDEYIVEPFLKEPLHAQYTEVKNSIENPKLATDAYLNKLEGSTAKQLLDSILTTNKGKVIYLDCWATWCGPCKEEMPNSKRLMEELKEKDVAFVFLCIDSEEKLWKANIAQLQLGGQHYYLSSEQSTDWRKVFEINGIPYYFLIDRDGVIVEKGSHLRPGNVKERLIGLLDK